MSSETEVKNARRMHQNAGSKLDLKPDNRSDLFLTETQSSKKRRNSTFVRSPVYHNSSILPLTQRASTISGMRGKLITNFLIYANLHLQC